MKDLQWLGEHSHFLRGADPGSTSRSASFAGLGQSRTTQRLQVFTWLHAHGLEKRKPRSVVVGITKRCSASAHTSPSKTCVHAIGKNGLVQQEMQGSPKQRSIFRTVARERGREGERERDRARERERERARGSGGGASGRHKEKEGESGTNNNRCRRSEGDAALSRQALACSSENQRGIFQFEAHAVPRASSRRGQRCIDLQRQRERERRGRED